MKLRHTRIKLSEANAFVEAHHRHHRPVIGHLFSLGAVLAGQRRDWPLLAMQVTFAVLNVIGIVRWVG